MSNTATPTRQRQPNRKNGQHTAPVLVRSASQQRADAHRDAQALTKRTDDAQRSVSDIRSALFSLAGVEDPDLAEMREMEQVASAHQALATLRSLSATTLAAAPDLLQEAQAAVRQVELHAQAALQARGLNSHYDGSTSGNGGMSSYLTKSSPTNSSPVSSGNQAGVAWAGVGNKRTDAQGVPNAQYLRNLATRNPWVQAAINTRKQQIGRANVAVTPLDETKPFDKQVQHAQEILLDYPNEYRDSYRSFIEPVIDDILTLDRGCISKDLDSRGVPHHLYFEDGATIKIYSDWHGDPRKPRYVFQPPNSTEQTPLFNEQLICIMANAASYRFGLSPVQVLLDTIKGDIAATEKAMNLVKDVPPPHLLAIKGANEQTIRRLSNQYMKDVAGRREMLFMGLTGDQEIKPYPLMLSLKEYQFMEWQEYLARKICAVFQISPQQIGLTFDINKATAEVQADLSEDNGILNLLLLIEEYLNRECLADFAPVDRDGRPQMAALNLRVFFPEVSEMQRLRHAAQVINTLVQATAGLPVLTLNMALRMLGEEPVDGGNTFWAPTTQGPMPWLSYDGATGDYGQFATAGMLGAQDPAGGIDEEAQDPKAAKDKGNRSQPSGGANNDTAMGNESSGTGELPDSGVAGGSDDSSTSTSTSAAADTATKHLTTSPLQPSALYTGQASTPLVTPSSAPLSVPHYVPLHRPDARQPGKHWHPASSTFDQPAVYVRDLPRDKAPPKKKPRTLGHIAPHTNQAQQRPRKVTEAQRQLGIQLGAIFEEAQKRGLRTPVGGKS